MFFAFVFCGQSIGQISSFIPDIIKARLAASLIFSICEYSTAIDSLSTNGLQLVIFLLFRSQKDFRIEKI